MWLHGVIPFQSLVLPAQVYNEIMSWTPACGFLDWCQIHGIWTLCEASWEQNLALRLERFSEILIFPSVHYEIMSWAREV